MLICATCAVEFDEPVPAVCPICDDERQWVPQDGRIYGNFGNVTRSGARRILRFSADRHAAWARGDHDDLTWCAAVSPVWRPCGLRVCPDKLVAC